MNEGVVLERADRQVADRTIDLWDEVSLGLDISQLELMDKLYEWLSSKKTALSSFLLNGKNKPVKPQVKKLSLELAHDTDFSPKEKPILLALLSRVITEGNKQLGWDLELPVVGAYLPREKGRFTPDRFSKRELHTHWLNVLHESFVVDKRLSGEGKLGRLFASALLQGGLASSHLLVGLLKSCNGPLEVVGNQAYLNLNLSWLGHEDVEFRRWFPDPLSEIILLNKDYEVPNTIPKNQSQLTPRIFKSISTFFREAGLDKRLRPASFTAMLDVCTLIYEFFLPPYIANYIQRNHLSHSLEESAIERMRGCMGAIKTDAEVAMDLELGVWPSNLNLTKRDEEDDRDLEGNPPWLTPIRRAINALTAEHMIKELRAAQQNQLIEQGTVSAMLLQWGEHLLTTGSLSRRILKPKTVNGYINSIVVRLGEYLHDQNMVELSEEAYEEIYTQVLDDASNKGHRRKLSRVLYEFHRFLVEQHNVVKIDYHDILGAHSSPAPVDANIVFIDEFKRMLRIVDESDMDLIHRDMPKIGKLISILGYRCGLRRSEALKLRLVDFQGLVEPVLLVRPHSARQLKTHSSTRLLLLAVLLEPEELTLLRDWYTQRCEEERLNPYSNYLFSIPQKKYAHVPEDLIYPAIHAALRAATGDPSIRYHHLRHSLASLMILRLTIAEHGMPEGLFEALPETEQWLRKSSRFRDKLYLLEGPSRKNLFYVTSILGHSLPDVTLEHYIHTLDILAAHIIRKEMVTPDKVLVAASGAPESTAYRWIKNGTVELLKKVRKRSGNVVIYKPLDTRHSAMLGKEAVEEQQQLQGYRRIQKIWRLLFLHSSQGIALDILAERFGLTTAEAQLLVDRANGLANKKSRDGRKSFRYRMMEAKLETGKKVRLLCPRSSVKEYDKDLEQRLIKGMIKLKADNPAALDKMLQTYQDHSWRTKQMVVLKDVKHLQLFLEGLALIGVADQEVQLTLLHGGASTSAWKRKAKEQWKGLLPKRSKIKWKSSPLTDGKTVGEYGWLGINIINSVTEKSSPAARYAFTMMSIDDARPIS